MFEPKVAHSPHYTTWEKSSTYTSYFLSVNKQPLTQTHWCLLSLFWSSGLWSISLSVPKTLSTFPYLSPRPGSPSSRLCCSKLGTGPKSLWAASPASPPRCPLPLLSQRIRTRPSRTALSSEANTNQPQMFTLGEKGQQMRSHSIKLASLPLSLCLSLFLTFSLFSASLQRTQGSSLDLWVGQLCSQALFVCTLCAVSHLGFPLKKKEDISMFQFFILPDTEQWSLRPDYYWCECNLQRVLGRILCAKLPSFRWRLTPESSLFDDKKRHNPGEEFQQQEQTGISPGNTRQTKLSTWHPWETGSQSETPGWSIWLQ